MVEYAATDQELPIIGQFFNRCIQHLARNQLVLTLVVAYNGRWIVGKYARHRWQVADVSVYHAEEGP